MLTIETNVETVMAPAGRSAQAQLSAYLGAWAMLADPLVGLTSLWNRPGFALTLMERGTVPPRPRYSLADGVAIIDLAGVLMKLPSWGNPLGGTADARDNLKAALADDRAKSIVLRIDSPGGTVAGTYDLVDDVASAKKPVFAYIEDCGCSAAYAVASAARQVFANSSALVGSIGTYAVMIDASKAAERMGLLVHVVRAGKFKGAGTPGTVITQEQLDAEQRLVDSLNEHFIASVARGRRASPDSVRGLADGSVHVAGEAKRLGLIDRVASFDEMLAFARR